MNMKDMGIVFGSAEQAVPLVIGKDTVYVHTDVQQILEDNEGKSVDNLFQYHEIQYDKDEYIAYLNNQLLQVQDYIVTQQYNNLIGSV
jgi:hypothetical protein